MFQVKGDVFFGKCLAVLLLTVFSPLLIAESRPILDYESRFHPAVGRGGMVVSQERLASRVGADILGQGGNAIDAAVATGFALAVTLPQAGNLGGGGFMLVYLADEDRTVAIDYREMAPAAAHRDMFLDENGKPDPTLSRFGGLSSGVPGTVAGLIHAHKKYGHLPLKTVMAPAIALAEKGFRIDYTLAWSLQNSAERLGQHEASRRYFFRENGYPLREGEHWRQADLAGTLKRIAKTEGEDFYRGKTARLLTAEMARVGGLITPEDLASYKVVEREPVSGEYRGYRVVSMPPPSSGGVHLVQMLNILEGWNLSDLGHNSADYLHRLVEAMRYAYADRSLYLGDPDYVDVPVATLIDKDYAEFIRRKIDLSHATPSSVVAPALRAFEESPQTTHYSTWDEAGNVVSNTYTLNFSYGNGISVMGAGFLLNNEMDDFAAKVGDANAYGLIGSDANAVAPAKRPLSSMTPTLLFKDGKPVMATGSPGGSRIITAVIQMILNVVDFRMNIAEATAAPRIHHQWFPDTVYLETGISTDTVQALSKLGHNTEVTTWSIGKTQTLTRDGVHFFGVSDYRWPGGSAESPD